MYEARHVVLKSSNIIENMTKYCYFKPDIKTGAFNKCQIYMFIPLRACSVKVSGVSRDIRVTSLDHSPQ